MTRPGDREQLSVLLLDSGRQCLPFLRALSRAGHRVTVACSGRLTTGYFSRYGHRRLLWPDYFRHPQAFADRLLAYVRRHRPAATLALGDVSAAIVARHKAELLPYTGLTVPDWEVFDCADDKGRTMAYCMKHGIPCPVTYDVGPGDLESVIDRLPFPVMVKPRRGIGAVGLHRIDTADELRRHFAAIHARYGELSVQEFIPLEGGTQYQAEAFVDDRSRMVVCTVISKPRFFPVTGGTATANQTIDRPDIQENVRCLLEGIGWRGAADVDLILDPRDNTAKILEINPRVTAGIKIGFAAGVDYADLHLRLATGRPIEPVEPPRLGVYCRNLCMDLLWYLFSNREARRSTPLQFFKFVGRDVHYQTFGIDDPMPLAGFFLGMLRKYADPQVWKAKLGRDLK